MSAEKTALAGAATPGQDLTATPVWRWSAMADRTFNCARCGKSCTYTYIKGIARMYCSPSCKTAAYQRRRGFRSNGKPFHTPEPRFCNMCGQPFMSQKGSHRFCTAACQMKAHGIVYRYRITLDEYKTILESQGGVCAIEGCDKTDLAVDHDHRCCPESGRSCGLCIRGLICSVHNKVLGFIDDDPTKLSGLADYLMKGTRNG